MIKTLVFSQLDINLCYNSMSGKAVADRIAVYTMGIVILQYHHEKETLNNGK